MNIYGFLGHFGLFQAQQREKREKKPYEKAVTELRFLTQLLEKNKEK